MTWHHNQLAKINIFLQLSQKKIKVFFIKILTKKTAIQPCISPLLISSYNRSADC